LLHVVQSLDSVAKVCLFVDGLDEFDGKHDELISLLNEMISKTSIKVCVASRFQVDHHFVHLQKREPQFTETLIKDVVGKASGVFLWVNLVVTSLIDGMQAGNRVSDLKRRLDLLPPDLDDLYDSILNTLEPLYLEHAAQYFNLVRAILEPPSAVVFYLADEMEPEDPTFALETLAAKDITSETMATRVDPLKRRLHSHCKGLVEIENSP
ncbi:hypothetical protein QBC36DRAFT_150972, partial [Triangularia setosa]